MKKCTGSLLFGIAIGMILSSKVNIVNHGTHFYINSNGKTRPFIQNNSYKL
jgi:hypothetical protein